MTKYKSFYLMIVFAVTTSLTLSTAANIEKERMDWEHYFQDFEAKGTLVIVDVRNQKESAWVYDKERANKQYSPASTFKIPHALFALDANIIRDEFEIIPWDHVKRYYPNWNRDQNLRSSIVNSTVWVYQQFAHKLGGKQEHEYLRKIHYGNENPTGADPFWIEGNLRISANEQIEFLKKLYRNELPFSVDHQRLVKDLMITEAGRDWILRAKTGWDGKIRWWIGWVELPEGAIFFALNMDTPNKMDDLPKAEKITRSVLTSLGATGLTTTSK